MTDHPITDHKGCARYKDRVALVVGGSRGIGFAVARRLLAEGAQVVITGRSRERLDAAVATLDGPVVGIDGDYRDRDHRLAVLDAATNSFGRLDLLVNNAATSPIYGDVLDADPSSFAKIMASNVEAPVDWIRQSASLLCSHHGSVVNVASIAGLSTSPGLGLYGASKAALIRLTVQLAAELAPAIRVNAVAPGIVQTDFIRARSDEELRELGRSYPMGRVGAPEDVAAAVAFLGSGDAAWITGHTIVIDGGLSASTPS